MCGIFAFIGKYKNKSFFIDDFNKIKNRGPDKSKLEYVKNNNSNNNFSVLFGFHRLAINDLSDSGDQPMNIENTSLICNGEIFNYKLLQNDNNFDYKSNSDCEIILHMYNKYDIKKTVNNLDAEFAFVLYDSNKDIVYAARDPFGVRPLFIGYDSDMNVYFSSEIKALSKLCTNIERFKPGCFWSSNTRQYTRYYNYNYFIPNDNKLITTDINEICSNINDLLVKAVQKRLMSDRPIGCLLSGGLDSSLISSIVAREFKKNNKGELNTFSIGMSGSTDLFYAKKVAVHIGSKHHHIELTPDDFLKAIPEVIYNIESYDTTSVRASVGNYLVGKYIKENTDITVVYNGDGSDEQSGYLYLKNAPNSEAFYNECIYLLKNIHMFDCLRSDRSVSSRWSLESRTPFLDKDFVQYYMSIDPKLKMYGNNDNRIEKYLLRRAFVNDNLLPNEVLWRAKEAFSDGCSSNENSWHNIIQNFVNDLITDDELKEAQQIYKHNPPQLKESLYYRKIFDSYFNGHSNVINNFWLPKWCGNQIDPSARVLDMYNKDENVNNS